MLVQAKSSPHTLHESSVSWLEQFERGFQLLKKIFLHDISLLFGLVTSLSPLIGQFYPQQPEC